MDRPSKVCVVSEAEVLSSSLSYLRNKTLMEGQPLQTFLIQKEVSYV